MKQLIIATLSAMLFAVIAIIFNLDDIYIGFISASIYWIITFWNYIVSGLKNEENESNK